MPVDVEQNKLDFYGRIFYRTNGWDKDTDEFFFSLWEENWHSEDTLRYGPPQDDDKAPNMQTLPHLVSSHLRGIPVKGARRDKRVFTATSPSERDLHAPALDLDFRVVQLEHQQPSAPYTLQTVQFVAPERMTRIELDILNRVMTKDLHLCDSVELRSEQSLHPRAQFSISMHFHPANRIHVVPSTKNYHLYINRSMPWDDYEYMLQALSDCKLLNPGFTDFSIYRHQSFLRYPGVTKVDLPGPDSQSRVNKDLESMMSLTYKAPPRIPLPTRSHEAVPVYMGGDGNDPF